MKLTENETVAAFHVVFVVCTQAKKGPASLDYPASLPLPGTRPGMACSTWK